MIPRYAVAVEYVSFKGGGDVRSGPFHAQVTSVPIRYMCFPASFSSTGDIRSSPFFQYRRPWHVILPSGQYSEPGHCYTHSMHDIHPVSSIRPRAVLVCERSWKSEVTMLQQLGYSVTSASLGVIPSVESTPSHMNQQHPAWYLVHPCKRGTVDLILGC